jgi:hypothetical protein
VTPTVRELILARLRPEPARGHTTNELARELAPLLADGDALPPSLTAARATVQAELFALQRENLILGRAVSRGRGGPLRWITAGDLP